MKKTRGQKSRATVPLKRQCHSKIGARYAQGLFLLNLDKSTVIGFTFFKILLVNVIKYKINLYIIDLPRLHITKVARYNIGNSVHCWYTETSPKIPLEAYLSDILLVWSLIRYRFAASKADECVKFVFCLMLFSYASLVAHWTKRGRLSTSSDFGDSDKSQLNQGQDNHVLEECVMCITVTRDDARDGNLWILNTNG